jgi:BirA family transcriptional regulator, biotin operon repressor / biotin---[acetyl-CoA-carboxylase] ligase
VSTDWPSHDADWPTKAIREAVAPVLPGFTVQVLAEIDSTNSELMRRGRTGSVEPVLLIAERQTAGRGRLGRNWVANPGESLTFSLGLPLAPTDWSGLSLVVGISLAESLHPRIQLKWPNDLWLSDRKLAGVLIETASFGAGGDTGRYAVIGIGINIAAHETAGLSIAPAWLQELLPGVQAGDLLLRVALPLVQAVQAFEAFGFAPFQARFNARDALRDRAVVLSDGTAGTAGGANEDGALRVHTARGMNTVASAEVSVRPKG